MLATVSEGAAGKWDSRKGCCWLAGWVVSAVGCEAMAVHLLNCASDDYVDSALQQPCLFRIL